MSDLPEKIRNRVLNWWAIALYDCKNMEQINDLKTVHDVLTVAFALQADRGSHGEPLRKMLIRQMESIPLTASQKQWYEQLTECSAKLAGSSLTLAQADDRFQSLLADVRGLMTSWQWAVIAARYSPLVGGANVKLVFPQEKVEAIALLARGALDVGLLSHDMLAITLVARAFAPNNVPGTSIRQLAGSFGMSKTTVGRLAQDLAKWLDGISIGAISIVDTHLRNNGILKA